MGPLRRATLTGAIALAILAACLAQPDPPQARANAACDIGGAVTSPIGGIAGAIGIGPGNPVADACNAVTDPILGAAGDAVLSPLKEAAASIGKGIFNQVTAWVADGAVWLLGEVAELTQKTTSPNLLSKGFLHQYKLMAQIAVAMAALMAILAIFEAIASGGLEMLGRVLLINVPVAAIATSAAYVVVQMLLATCDGMCAAITQSTGADSHHFLQGAVKALAIIGGATGSSGAVAVPLFVGFIAVVVAAFAALFVWLELLMRDAAVYVVALFMPLALAASIWPRWVSALRRTAELLIVLVFSKFVIVAIIALAASLLANSEGSIEHVMAATVMLLLACFSPFVLFKLVPFAEGALASAYGRQSAAGGAVRTVELGNSMMMMRRLSRANWAAAAGKEGGGGKGSGSAGGGGETPGGPASGGGGAQGGAEAGAAGGASAAGAVPVAVGAAAATGARKAGERMGETGVAQEASESHGAGSEAARPSGGAGESPSRPDSTPRPSAAGGGEAEAERPAPSEGGASSTPRPQPSQATGGEAEPGGATVPRPQGGEGGASGAGGEAVAP